MFDDWRHVWPSSEHANEATGRLDAEISRRFSKQGFPLSMSSRNLVNFIGKAFAWEIGQVDEKKFYWAADILSMFIEFGQRKFKFASLCPQEVLFVLE